MSDHRLLIIDDDVRLAEMLTEYLAPEGIELTSVASGIQGLRSAQRENYDLIILDVMLPGLSGFDVLKQLREAGVKTPVVMLT
ncbi:MAG TPA: response regulator, partial [Gammaproteobacteria bacterium]|nr:response regulator [Gammaproteobacteria bacterium]